MDVESCYLLGHVVKTHGLQGELKLFLDVDDPQQYKDLESVWLEDHGQSLIPFFIDRLLIEPRRVTARFEDVDDHSAAQALVGKKLYLPLDTLPPLEGAAFYYHDIIGYQLIDQKHGALGKVEQVYEAPLQDLISTTYRDKEVLIPITKAIIVGLDRKEKVMNISLPEGLLEVYL
ncbi:MAG: ribosome maturation factor RimM [Cyclobacteriaceae bacterium]